MINDPGKHSVKDRETAVSLRASERRCQGINGINGLNAPASAA